MSWTILGEKKAASANSKVHEQRQAPPSTLYIQIAVKIKLPILNKDIPGTKTQIYERTKRPTGTGRESMK